MLAILGADNCHQNAIINVCKGNAYALVLRPRTTTERHGQAKERHGQAKDMVTDMLADGQRNVKRGQPTDSQLNFCPIRY